MRVSCTSDQKGIIIYRFHNLIDENRKYFNLCICITFMTSKIQWLCALRDDTYFS